MKRAIRFVTCAALLCFAASFFLPPQAFNTPVRRLVWAAEAVVPVENGWESAAFAAVCLAIVYPYAWALAAGALAAVRTRVRPGIALWLHFGCHAAGGVAISFVGILLLVIRDTWLPGWVQWLLAVLPACLLAFMLVARFLFRASRRVPAVTALGALPQIPLQLVLAHELRLEGYPAWGFYTAGVAAAVAFLAGLAEFFARDTPLDKITTDHA